MIKKEILQATLRFCMAHWKEILLVLSLVGLYVKTQFDYRNLVKAHEISEQSLRNQLETMQSLHNEELRLRDAAVENYKQQIKDIEEKYSEEQTELVEESQDTVEEISREIIERDQLDENKHELAEKVREAFGFEYVP